MKIIEIFETMEYSPAPENPALALDWLKEHKHKSKFGLFINGKWCKAKSGKVFSTDNPASGKKLASISEAGKSDVDSAVRAAKLAFPKWKFPDMSVPAIYMLSPDSCKNTHGYLLSLKLWITEKRFAKPVTSTFRS